MPGEKRFLPSSAGFPCHHIFQMVPRSPAEGKGRFPPSRECSTPRPSERGLPSELGSTSTKQLSGASTPPAVRLGTGEWWYRQGGTGAVQPIPSANQEKLSGGQRGCEGEDPRLNHAPPAGAAPACWRKASTAITLRWTSPSSVRPSLWN